MQSFHSGSRVGDLVRLRGQRWRVADVRAHDDCALLTLSGAGAANLGVERRFVAPFDVVEPVHEPMRPRIGGAHQWRGRLRALIADAGSTEILRTASRADIALLPHQLEPALAVTRGMGARVLIADEVGLGKTIQAGLIIAELRARGAADRVLIITPAGLRDQWVNELHHRFGLDGALLDARAVRQRLSQIATGVNPWITCPIVVTSGDYIKRPEVLAAVAGCRWDVLIVDEAHGAPPGTDRQRACAFLAERTPYVVLLTATPHSGDRDAFRSLCSLGSQPPAIPARIDPQRLLVFRRTRKEVALGPGRRVHRVLVAPTADERRMHLLLGEFSAAVRQDRGDGDRDAWLALTMLHKRAFSSARALELTVRRRMLGLVHTEEPGQLLLPLDEDGENDQADAAPEWTGPALNDPNRERALLAALAEAAARAAEAESKVGRLSWLLTTLGRRGEQALVFTEYRDTLNHLRGRLTTPSGVLHGGLSRTERRAAIDDFDSGRTPVLLATDAAGEGLNLHRACRVVITLELPWNPIRLEQRIGRVDRIGQKRRVHAFHLIARQTGESAIAARLRSRIAISQLEMGAADPLDDADADRHAERLAEQDVVGGRWLDSAGHPHQAESPIGARPAAHGAVDLLQFVRLKPEAAAEHARLERARRLLGREVRADRLHEAGPLISRAGSPAMRALIGSRWLVIVRSAIEDACGRVVGVCLTPLRLKVDLPTGIGSLQIARGVGREIEECVAAAVRRDREAWVSNSVSFHSAFWATRIARECPKPIGDENGRLVQLGLFTRHADRLESSPQANAVDTRRSISDVVWRASELHITKGRVALLILP